MTMASTFSKTFQTLREEGAGAAVAKAAHRTRFVLDLVAATRALRSKARRMRDIPESLDFAYRYAAGEVAIAPAQVRTEIASLLELLEAAPPARVLEIGTAR